MLGGGTLKGILSCYLMGVVLIRAPIGEGDHPVPCRHSAQFEDGDGGKRPNDDGATGLRSGEYFGKPL
jgi:hypothetical protein